MSFLSDFSTRLCVIDSHAGRYLLQQQMEAEREKMKVIVSKSPEKVDTFVARSFSLIKSLRRSGKKIDLETNPLIWQYMN